MTPARFRLKVADHRSFYDIKDESRAIQAVAFELGWLDHSGITTENAPPWLDRYRNLVSWRATNRQIAAAAAQRATECDARIEELFNAHA